MVQSLLFLILDVFILRCLCRLLEPFITYWSKIFFYYNINTSIVKVRSVRTKNSNFWLMTQKHILLKSIRRLCIDYVGIVMPSLILTESQQMDLNLLLRKQFETINNDIYHNMDIIKFKLLYRINNIDEFDLVQYKSTCIDHKNTLMLIRNNVGHIFGAFTTRGIPPFYWFDSSFCDPYLFLFSISPKPQIFPQKNPQLNKQFPINMFSQSRYIAIFGVDDLTIMLDNYLPIVSYPAKKLKKFNTCFASPHVFDFDAHQLFGGTNFLPQFAECTLQSMELFKLII